MTVQNATSFAARAFVAAANAVAFAVNTDGGSAFVGDGGTTFITA